MPGVVRNTSHNNLTMTTGRSVDRASQLPVAGEEREAQRGNWRAQGHPAS